MNPEDLAAIDAKLDAIFAHAARAPRLSEHLDARLDELLGAIVRVQGICDRILSTSGAGHMPPPTVAGLGQALAADEMAERLAIHDARVERRAADYLAAVGDKTIAELPSRLAALEKRSDQVQRDLAGIERNLATGLAQLDVLDTVNQRLDVAEDRLDRLDAYNERLAATENEPGRLQAAEKRLNEHRRLIDDCQARLEVLERRP